MEMRISFWNNITLNAFSDFFVRLDIDYDRL